MKDLAQSIIDNIKYGRAMIGVEAGGLLMELVAKTTGDYIEIGSYAGGSAIMAATAMEEADRPGMVFCIDPFGAKNEIDEPDELFGWFWKNLFDFGVDQRVIAFKQYNPPFPTAIYFHKFSVGLIDGSHTENGPLRDFWELTKRVRDYLIFDNAEKEKVEYTIDLATSGGTWVEHASLEYESQHPDKKIKFVVLRRKEIESSD